MSRDELLEYCRQLVSEKGPLAVSFNRLRAERGLYGRLYEVGLPVRVLVAELGIKDEYREKARATFDRFRDGQLLQKWSWDSIAEACRAAIARENFLPPAAWFQRHGMGSFVQAVYTSGLTWEDLRIHFESYTNSVYVVSRAGLHWRSRAEASLSNFLYAREVEHRCGRDYPPEYTAETGRQYGKYDVEFRAHDGRWIDVEIWGDKPNGASAAAYAQKRAIKEAFNARFGDRFLGIHFLDCYDERRLEVALSPYLGTMPPVRFDYERDRKVDSVHWTNADELVAFCRSLAASQPDGVFPTEEWLRKRGKWRNRGGPAYNGVSWYIQRWLGGIRVLRELLGQPDNSTRSWSRAAALEAYALWYAKYHLTPGQARYAADEGRLAVSRSDYWYAGRLNAAVKKYVGSIGEVHRCLKLPPVRAAPAR